MGTLTKEYFDQRLNEVQVEIKREIQKEVHNLATITAGGFEDIIKRLDVRDRVEKLETKMSKVETALNVRL
jgi:phosphoribosylaminoimidazole (AIR) synthetase